MATNPTLSTNVGVSQIFLEQIQSAPPISTNSVTGFQAIANVNTRGVDVSFALTNVTGVASVTLVRASTPDIAQATVLQTWTASVSSFTWSDTDVALQSMPQAYYWLKLEPVNATGTEADAGPQTILLNPSAAVPATITGISASHDVALNGNVMVTVNVAGLPSGSTLKIYAANYQGVSGYVAVASSPLSQVQFTLKATGETVTLKGISVSISGVEATSGPTTTLTLSGTRTAPSAPENCTIVQIGSNNNLQFSANLESYVTGYQIYRGATGTSFSSATLLTTVSAGASTLTYSDNGVAGIPYQYFLIAVSASGNSAPGGPFLTSGLVYTGSGPMLQNPNFAGGDTGWTKGAGWSIVAGSNPVGGSYLGEFNSSTPGSESTVLSNVETIPVSPGDVLAVTAVVDGTGGTAGAMQIGVIWQGVSFGNGNAVGAGSGPAQSRYSGACPAGCTLANVYAYPNGATGAWKVYGFTAAILPSTLNDVPDSGSRYAAVETGADKTLNHVLTTSITYPGAPSVPAASMTATVLSWIVTANDTSDVFNVLASIYLATPESYWDAYAVGVVDGVATTQFGYGELDAPSGSAVSTIPIAYSGSCTGLSPGSHTITIYLAAKSLISPYAWIAASSGPTEARYWGQIQQISS